VAQSGRVPDRARRDHGIPSAEVDKTARRSTQENALGIPRQLNAVSFENEWHDDSGQWFRSYGSELWEFDDRGLMRRRLASINDAGIAEADRRLSR
jgi:nuclear transport factor 2 (NTF2) superfamily protein